MIVVIYCIYFDMAICTSVNPQNRPSCGILVVCVCVVWNSLLSSFTVCVYIYFQGLPNFPLHSSLGNFLSMVRLSVQKPKKLHNKECDIKLHLIRQKKQKVPSWSIVATFSNSLAKLKMTSGIKRRKARFSKNNCLPSFQNWVNV